MLNTDTVKALRAAPDDEVERQADRLLGGRGQDVLSGGDGPPRDVTEQDIIDLEREATLKLLGTAETQARIKYMLETGKPLRN